MKFQVNDKAGYTLAEGRLNRNRQEALAIVERIERRMEIEKVIHRPAAVPAEFLHERQRSLAAPMATRRNYPRIAAWVLVIWTIAIIAGIVGM